MLMKRNMLLSAFILCSGLTGLAQARPVSCSTHKIYCAIKKLQPKADNSFAMELSNLIYVESKKANIDPMISVAIAMQETSLQPKTHRQQTVIIKVNDEYKIVKGYTDMGLFQFHVNTIQAYNLDINKLDNNLEYAVKSHFMILKDKMKQCKAKYNDIAWACYHSSTPKFFIKYYNYVIRHYNKIKEQK